MSASLHPPNHVVTYTTWSIAVYLKGRVGSEPQTPYKQERSVSGLLHLSWLQLENGTLLVVKVVDLASSVTLVSLVNVISLPSEQEESVY